MKKVLISMLTLIFIVLMITTVYASTAAVTLGPSSNTVIKGKTFTITVTATGENNVTGLKGTLSYDTTKLLLENKSTSNGFQEVGISNELNAGIISIEGITLSKSVATHNLTFKVLDEAAEGETEISLSNIELALVNDSQEQIDVNANNANVKITIKADDTTAGNQGDQEQKPENTVDTPSNNDNNNNVGDTNTDDSKEDKKENTIKNVSSNKNTNKNTTKLPQTGAESASVSAIIALGSISIASYVSYRKYKNI